MHHLSHSRCQSRLNNSRRACKSLRHLNFPNNWLQLALYPQTKGCNFLFWDLIVLFLTLRVLFKFQKVLLNILKVPFYINKLMSFIISNLLEYHFINVYIDVNNRHSRSFKRLDVWRIFRGFFIRNKSIIYFILSCFHFTNIIFQSYNSFLIINCKSTQFKQLILIPLIHC